MNLTTDLLQQPPHTNLTTYSSNQKENLKTADLLKAIARETFNGTMPVVIVKNQTQFKQAIKLAIASKYTPAKEVATLSDLIAQSQDRYFEKLHNKLIRAAKSIGTHVPKTTSTCIQDAATNFATPPPLESGITSATVNSGRWVTGSKDGTLVAAFGFLSATYQIDDGPPLSLYDRLIIEDNPTIELLIELSKDKDFVRELMEAAQQHKNNHPITSVSQFYKQNFINFGGKRITITPLQSVNTTVALKQSIDKLYKNNGRVSIKRYVAGGAQSQNVSSLNQDLGGSTPHLKAWIPSTKSRNDVFYYLYYTKNFSLTTQQKSLIKTLAWSIRNIENKGHSNHSDRTAVKNLFTQQIHHLLQLLESFACLINAVEQQTTIDQINKKINPLIKDYFTADRIQSKSEASENIAIEYIALVAREMKRNKLSIPIEDSALNAAAQVLQHGEVLCPSL